MRVALRTNISLYRPSQSMGAMDEEETRCWGEAVPLTGAAVSAAPSAIGGADPAAGGVELAAAADGTEFMFQWEQPGCGSSAVSFSMLVAAAPLLPSAEAEWCGADAAAVGMVTSSPLDLVVSLPAAACAGSQNYICAKLTVIY